MTRSLVIPADLGEGVEVRVLLWYKAEGERIGEGDAILEFETDKAIVVVTARQGGVLRRCFAPAGEWLGAGQVAAWVSDGADDPLPGDRGAPAEALLAAFETT